MSDSAAADSAEVAGAPPEAVRRALAQVLDAEELRSSPQLSNILRFIVEATLQGRAEAIKGYTIAVEALGRDPSFDPQADPIVRVEATRLRRALERYYAGAGADDEIEIAVPRGSYVPQFVSRRSGGGPPIIPDEAPLPEIDSAGAMDPLPVGANETEAVSSRRRLSRLVGLAALTAVALLLVTAFTVDMVDPTGWRSLVSGAALRPIERANRLGIPMIEVRSFDSTGGRPLPPSEIAGSSGAITSGDFSARALEVRVRDALARFDLLDVLSSPDVRPAVNCGAGSNSPHSAFALGGLVENHDDGSTSLLLRLSDLCDGTIVWSREFDGLKRGADATASEVALIRDIMAAIAEPYGVIQARARAQVMAAGGPTNAGPYGCVLMAYAYWRSYRPLEHQQARTCLEAAVAADPTFALGYALLAELSLDEIRNGVPAASPKPAVNRALAAAEQAVELAPGSSFAQRVLMHVHFFRGERGGVIAAGEAALALNPYDVDVLADYGGHLVLLGDIGRGEAMLASAVQIAPGMPPSVDYYRVIAAYLRGDAPAAAAAADQLMAEGYAPGLLARGLAAHLAGEEEAARADIRRLTEVAPLWASDAEAMITRFFPSADIARQVREDLVALGLPMRNTSAAAN